VIVASATVAAVADDPAQVTVYDVTCPHCNKTFREELLTGPAERYHGFKCPHCRLFVPLERVSEQNGVEPGD
jgi:phage FluMu protein Com